MPRYIRLVASSGRAGNGGQPRIDTSVAHSARVHDYWLGGKDNFAAGRAAGDAVMAAYPGIVQSVRANRAFLARVVRSLAAEAGITQFLDIGTGIPASNNTHEVAQAVTPAARVDFEAKAKSTMWGGVGAAKPLCGRNFTRCGGRAGWRRLSRA